MAYNFPDSPSNGNTVTIGNVTYTYNSTSGAWKTTAASGGGSGASVTSSDTAPSSPSAGDLWYDTTTLRLYVYYNDGSSSQWVKANPSGSSGALVQESAPSNAGSGNLWFDPSTLETYVYYNDGDSNQWVQTNPGASSSGTTVYSSIDDLPLSGVETGAQAFVSSTNRLYLWNGTGWYNIALINTTPSISGASSAYVLETDGTATTVTITATDAEGIPITYSIASDTSGNIATVSQGTGSNTNVFTITPSTNTANTGTFSLTFRASDGVNIATAISSFTLQFSVENSNYTTALITSVGANNAVNNSFDDASTNNHTITANGNVTQNTFSPYRHGGYSTYFDGTGDYVTAPSGTSFDFGTGDFTIETWINIPDVTSTWLAFISRGYAQNGGWRLYKNTGNNNLRFYYTDSGTSSHIEASTTGLTNNTWHHITVVRNSSTTKIYVDGVEKGSGTISTSLNPGSYAVEVGSGVVQSSYPITGYMTDVRIVKGTAVYTSAFTPPTERLTAITNTSLLTCHLPYIADGSTNGHSITVAGNTKTEPFSPYDYEIYSATDNGGSMSFDGTGDNLTTSTAILSTTGGFTVQCWVYLEDTSNAAIWAQGTTGNAARASLSIENGNWYAQIGSAIINTTAAVANVWKFLEFQYSGSQIELFIDGTSVGTASNTQNAQNTGLFIGKLWAANYDLNGYISNLRVIDGTPSGSSSIPTTPLTAITNTSLLLNGTDAAIIDKSQSVKTITLNGDVKSSTTQTKFLSSSMKFDGNGDYIAFTSDLYGWTGDFTIEAWVYHTSFGTYSNPIYTTGANTSLGADFFELGANSGGAYQVFWGSGSPLIVATAAHAVPVNTWSHIALTRSGSTLRLYLNGTLSVSTTKTGALPSSTTDRSFIGTQAYGAGATTRSFYGYMSDVRLTKGLARYTSNFTAPTAALQG